MVGAMGIGDTEQRNTVYVGNQVLTWGVPSLLLAGIIAWPFTYLFGPWALLIGLPGAAAVLLLLDRADFIESDLRAFVVLLLLAEFGGFVALLVVLARSQAKAVGWWLPLLEAVVLAVVAKRGVRALRRQRRKGKQLVLDDLSLGEARKLMTLGKVAVGHAERLVAGRPGVDRTGAVRDLRRRMKHRPELGPVLATAISERRTVWGWVPTSDPATLAVAVELVDQAAAAPPAS
jgi:hypothetical protein